MFSVVDSRSETGHEELLTVSHIDGVRRRADKTVTMFMAESLEGYKRCQPGDLIINTMWAWMGALGVSKLAGIVSPSYHVYRAQSVNTYEPRYFNYFFRTPEYVKEITRNSRGVWTSRLRLYPEEFLDMEVWLPPLPVQRTIADFLDRKTAALDALIAKKTRLLALLAEKRAALINQAVTRGLDPDVPMKDSGIEWIGAIPAHWEVRRLKRLAQVRGGVTKGQNNAGHQTVSLPYLRVANVQDGYLDLNTVHEIEVRRSDIDRFRLLPGDILMNEGGDNDKLGRGAVWAGQVENCLHQNHVFAVRPFHGVDPYWVNLATQSSYLKHFFYRRANQSTNLASISSSNLKEAPIVWPPVEEQQVIQSKLMAVLRRTHTIEEKTTTQITRLKEYRQALITAAVTGQLDIPEPASDVSILPWSDMVPDTLAPDGPS